MSYAISAVSSFLSKFSLRGLIILASVLIVVGAVGFLGYEWYTSHFRFVKVQKSLELLEKLDDIQKKDLDASSQVIYDSIQLRLQKITEIDLLLQKKFDLEASHPSFPLEHFFGGSFWWIILAVVFEVVNIRERQAKAIGKEATSSLLMILSLGFVWCFIVSILFALSWPWSAFLSPWIVLFLSPLGFIIVTPVLILITTIINKAITTIVREVKGNKEREEEPKE